MSKALLTIIVPALLVPVSAAANAKRAKVPHRAVRFAAYQAAISAAKAAATPGEKTMFVALGFEGIKMTRAFSPRDLLNTVAVNAGQVQPHHLKEVAEKVRSAGVKEVVVVPSGSGMTRHVNGISLQLELGSSIRVRVPTLPSDTERPAQLAARERPPIQSILGNLSRNAPIGLPSIARGADSGGAGFSSRKMMDADPEIRRLLNESPRSSNSRKPNAGDGIMARPADSAELRAAIKTVMATPPSKVPYFAPRYDATPFLRFLGRLDKPNKKLE